MSFQAKIFVLGASIACLGAYALVSGARHHLIGVRATATFITYADECTVEFQRIGEGHSRKTMSCDDAEHMRRELGSKKVELTRVPGVQFRFTLASGEVRELVRSRTVLGSPNMTAATHSPLSTTLPILMMFGSYRLPVRSCCASAGSRSGSASC